MRLWHQNMHECFMRRVKMGTGVLRVLHAVEMKKSSPAIKYRDSRMGYKKRIAALALLMLAAQ